MQFRIMMTGILALISQGVSAATLQGQGYTLQNFHNSFDYAFENNSLVLSVNKFFPGDDVSGWDWNERPLADFQIQIEQGYALKSLTFGFDASYTQRGTPPGHTLGISGYSTMVAHIFSWSFLNERYNEQWLIGDSPRIYQDAPVSVEESAGSLNWSYTSTQARILPAVEGKYYVSSSYIFNANKPATLSFEKAYWVFEVVAVPEPSTYGMLLLGLAGMAYRVRYSKKEKV